MTQRPLVRTIKAALNRVRYLRVLEPLRSRLFAAGYRIASGKEMGALLFRLLRPDLLKSATEVEVMDSDGLRFYCRPGEFLDAVLINNRIWEPHTRLVMRQVLQPGDTFFDVGAHIGTESLFGSRLVGGRGRVISFEPAPWLLPRLVRHLEINGAANVSVLNVAVGAAPGLVTLQRVAGNDGQSRVGTLSGAPTETAQCHVVTLDDIWRALGRPKVQLIKIDVEGFEPMVLSGAAELLKRVPHLLFEALWDVQHRSDASGALVEQLRGDGWTLRHWDGHNWTESVPSGLAECDIWATREAGVDSARI